MVKEDLSSYNKLEHTKFTYCELSQSIQPPFVTSLTHITYVQEETTFEPCIEWRLPCRVHNMAATKTCLSPTQ